MRRQGAKPLSLGLARDFVRPSCQEIQSQRPHPVASLEAIPPNWQNIQIDQAEKSHPTDRLVNTCFFVIIDEGCHLKVAEMLFPMKDTDLHRNPVWTELRDFYLEQWACVYWRRQRRTLDLRSPAHASILPISTSRQSSCMVAEHPLVAEPC